mmetsp:Transcript_22275/g.41871  ORF Transcript_22275/g.41871 Transcript_22275/m.41871 type:complete len:92 (-) Transcript_22275:191-466(-)
MTTDALNALGDLYNDEIDSESASIIPDLRNILKEDDILYERRPLMLSVYIIYVLSPVQPQLAALYPPANKFINDLQPLLLNLSHLQQSFKW